MTVRQVPISCKVKHLFQKWIPWIGEMLQLCNADFGVYAIHYLSGLEQNRSTFFPTEAPQCLYRLQRQSTQSIKPSSNPNRSDGKKILRVSKFSNSHPKLNLDQFRRIWVRTFDFWTSGMYSIWVRIRVGFCILVHDTCPSRGRNREFQTLVR